MEFTYRFKNSESFLRLCGTNDQNIRYFEGLFGVLIIPRGNTLIIQADNPTTIEQIKRFFHYMESYMETAKDLKEIGKREIETIHADISFQTGENQLRTKNRSLLLHTKTGEPIYPKSQAQQKFVESVFQNTLTFITGPAGTGKTMLSIVMAIWFFKKGRVERVVLSRPAVEAGEQLGFLPGDLISKVDPYLRPLFDHLYYVLGMEKVQKLLANQVIEVAPLAYMRGRTLNNSFIILDEAQNCSYSQLKMFLTRLGDGSKMIIAGDTTQTDLQKNQSGLLEVIEILKGSDDMGFIHFQKEDVFRHPLVREIVHRFDQYEQDHKPNC